MSARDPDTSPRRRPWLMALPLVAFAALAALFWFRLGSGDPSRIPSALIGRPAPQTALPPLEGLVAAARKCPGSILQCSRARSASSTSGPRGACPATTKRRC